MGRIIRVAAATPRVQVAQVDNNKNEIIRLAEEAASEGAAYVAFPAYALTGATCGDLLRQQLLSERVAAAREEIEETVKRLGISVILDKCTIDGITFEPAAEPEMVTAHRKRREKLCSITAAGCSSYVYCAAGYGESTTDGVYAGGSLICHRGRLLAENERFRTESSIIFADLDMDAEPAETLPSEDSPAVNAHPFVPADSEELADRCSDILDIQITALMTRMEHISCRSAVIGISGGLDSTLAVLVTVLAFDRLGLDRRGILAVTMPGFGTSTRTHTNALKLMEGLGVSVREISIVPAVQQHFGDIGHDPEVKDTTFENAQARERTQILMDIANETGGIVVGTGDLSEIALGWCTYNGDHMSMYGVNAGVPKTLMQAMVRWAAEHKFTSLKDTLLDIVDTPISPELTPADDQGQIKQKTENLVGPYELHDFFLYHFVRHGRKPSEIRDLACEAFDGEYDRETIDKWLRSFLRRFFNSQFKRSCSPDAPRIGSVSLSPRGAWAMPSDVSSAQWLADLD